MRPGSGLNLNVGSCHRTVGKGVFLKNNDSVGKGVLWGIVVFLWFFLSAEPLRVSTGGISEFSLGKGVFRWEKGVHCGEKVFSVGKRCFFGGKTLLSDGILAPMVGDGNFLR